MNPKQYEEFVAGYYQRKGYKVTLTHNTNDSGVDIIAEKGKEMIRPQKIVIRTGN